MVAINAAYTFLSNLDADPVQQDADATNYDFAEALQTVISELAKTRWIKSRSLW